MTGHQKRELDNIPKVRSLMHKASRQQWNIIELLHLTGGPMPLYGKWKQQRAVRSLIRRGVLESVETFQKQIISVQFTPAVCTVIDNYEHFKGAGLL